MATKLGGKEERERLDARACVRASVCVCVCVWVCVCVRACATPRERGGGVRERGRACLCVFRGEGHWDLVITQAPVNNAVRLRASKCNISSRTYIYPV